MKTSIVVKAMNLSKEFDRKQALNNINFTIKKGEIFGFLGPSGSGKTTTINILTKQLQADSGNVSMFCQPIQHMSNKDLETIGIMSDASGYFEKLSLYKNLQFYGKLFGKKKEYIEDLLKKVDLYDSRNKPAEKLSTGMKQRMLLARALINRPKLLFLDEPTSGLDPMTSRKIHKLLENLRNQGTTIFLTTHDMDEATKLCDNLVLLHDGKVVESGTPEDIIQKYNTDIRVEVTFLNKRKRVVTLNELKRDISHKEIQAIHTCEPTLEDVFIKLTGEKLND